ncbi:DUF4843 domain-containing protein [Alistipes sp.]|uniref:DUF4843 domain-containing protein n=1 Tax=Alistipes sp. TaxID=1872444 RepID=UPI003AB2F9E6
MNRLKVVSLALIAGAAILSGGCSQDDLSAYATKDSAVYFPSNNQSYSFIDTPDAEYADVEIKLNIIGPMADYDRPVAVEVNEEATTATAGQYTVLGGLVKAGATSGTVTVRVNNDKQALAQGDLALGLRLLGNDQFSTDIDPETDLPVTGGALVSTEAVLTWSNDIKMPEYMLQRNFLRYVSYTALWVDDDGNVYGEQDEAKTRKRLSAKYSSNGLYSKNLAKVLREVWPEVLNVFGYLGTDADILEKYPMINPGNVQDMYTKQLFHKLETYIYEYNLAHPDDILRHSDDAVVLNAAGNIVSVKSGDKTYELKLKENPPILVNPFGL